MKDLEKIFLMGLGAMSMTTEKAIELKEELLKKGKEAYEKGYELNEELKHNINNNITIVSKDTSKEDIIKIIKTMNKEEKTEILNLLKGKNKNE